MRDWKRVSVLLFCTNLSLIRANDKLITITIEPLSASGCSLNFDESLNVIIVLLLIAKRLQIKDQPNPNPNRECY